MNADAAKDHALRLLKAWTTQVRAALASPARLLSSDDREAIEREIHDGAQLTNAYGFLLFAACGIAALGLLQSSVAVVIGAMLISPLMGPILSMGLALARVEPRAFKTAAVTLAVGAALSILASTIIVWISPLKDITPEILARTRPTLLDLIIALLSGFVGAYLSLNRKGGAIAGVAIATALMPPLAVVGFGLATGAWNIAAGASLLFLTNVVAILGAVFGVARRYGFQPTSRMGASWEVPALLLVTGLLCVPLAFSLRDIVVETRETTRVRAAIERTFTGANPHITDLQVRSGPDGVSDVQCVVVTRRYVPRAATEIARLVSPGASVTVEQVVTATGLPKPDAAGGALGNRPSLATPTLGGTTEDQVRTLLSRSGQVRGVNRVGEVLRVAFEADDGATLADYQATEQAVRRLVPGAPVQIIPPLMPLPEVPFTRGTTTLNAAGRAAIDTTAWALTRWSVRSVTVEGRASPNPRGRRAVDFRVAEARAKTVADRLRQAGIDDITLATQVPETLDGPEAPYLTARVSRRPAASAPGAQTGP